MKIMRAPPYKQSFNEAQGGFSLIVSLLMLVVIIILGIGASNIALNEERASRNDRDFQIAFQAAQAALKDAEMDIQTTLSTPAIPGPPAVAAVIATNTGRLNAGTIFDGLSGVGFVQGGSGCTGSGTSCCSVAPNAGLCETSTTTTPIWQNVDFTVQSAAAQTVAYGTFTNQTFRTGAGMSAIPPRYIIERVPKNNIIGTDLSAGGAPQFMYRITAVGFGATTSFGSNIPNAQVVLQSIVNTLQ